MIIDIPSPTYQADACALFQQDIVKQRQTFLAGCLNNHVFVEKTNSIWKAVSRIQKYASESVRYALNTSSVLFLNY